MSAPAAFPELLLQFVPYTLVLVLFGAFVLWNGGIVLGAESRRQSCYIHEFDHCVPHCRRQG